jgi:carboxyl-terminal processing protease
MAHPAFAATDAPVDFAQQPAPAADQSADSQSRAQTLAILRQAYDLLMDRFVHAPDPAALLTAAWGGITRELVGDGMNLKDSSLPTLPANREQAWTVFRDRLAKLMADENPPAEIDLKAAGIVAMTRSLEEGHTAFLTAKAYKEFLSYLRGDSRYEGIGIRPRRPGITVSEVFPGSPAEKAGLQVGDQIVAVNGETTENRSLEDVSNLIRGPEGTPVNLVILRPKTNETLNVQVVRAQIKIDFVTTQMIQGDIAYIRLLGFPDPNVADRIEEFMGQLQSNGARAMILDLRGNAGGRVDVGVRLLNKFISSGPLFQFVDRSGTNRMFTASGPAWAHPLPMVILIDGGTASMGEIFAQAMKERGLARIVGQRSSGNVAAAQVFALNDGSAVQVTILEILSGSGVVLNKIGVAPDDVMETSLADAEKGRDVPLEHSVLYLRDQIARAQ